MSLRHDSGSCEADLKPRAPGRASAVSDGAGSASIPGNYQHVATYHGPVSQRLWHLRKHDVLKRHLAGVSAVIASTPKLVPVLQIAADYSPPARGGFQDLATLVAALLGHIERTRDTLMWWEGASYVSIFPVLWYAKNAGRFGSVAHRRLLVIAGLFALLSLGGVYPAVFGGVPVLKSQNATSRLLLMSILVFAASLATGEWNRPGQPRWRDAYLIVMGYVAMTWWTWTVTWNFDTPRF